jgi:hypothetical protein
VSKNFDRRKHNEFDEDFDYGERLHREKTKKIKRGKNRYFDEVEVRTPRRDKPSKRSAY